MITTLEAIPSHWSQKQVVDEHRAGRLSREAFKAFVGAWNNDSTKLTYMSYAGSLYARATPEGHARAKPVEPIN